MNDSSSAAPDSSDARAMAAINDFYSAFARLDAAAMAQHYATDARFRDPVFTLQGEREIAAMWSLLCEAVRREGMADWNLTYGSVQATAVQGTAHWNARYRFSATGRLVHNHITARFRFDAGGRIVEHHDDFPFWRWSRQALGMPGLLLGWTPFLQGKVRTQARRRLERYLAQAPAGPALPGYQSGR